MCKLKNKKYPKSKIKIDHNHVSNTTDKQYFKAIAFFSTHCGNALQTVLAFGSSKTEDIPKITVMLKNETKSQLYLRMLSYLSDPSYLSRRNRNKNVNATMGVKLFGDLL